MDEKQVRECVIRWLSHLVQDCHTSDADMVAMVLGIGGCGELRSAAQRLIHELEELHMAERWNRRAELTCHVDLTESNEPANINTWECSLCGRSFEEAYGSYEYCPHCGARIVEERR